VRDHVLRVRAVDIDTRQRGTRAVGGSHEAVDVLFATEVASPATPLHHRQPDAIADDAFRHAVANRHHLSHALVSENQRELSKLQRAVSEPQIRATDSAGVNAHQHLSGPHLGPILLLQLPRAFLFRYDYGFHPRGHPDLLIDHTSVSMATRYKSDEGRHYPLTDVN
jgi:hypothetical protein